ncbi:MAG TPA: cupredoxin domain-containing protein [Candidatus Acidoferrales bacterium]|nr:cupredoxin domain-containing protein [Candidatus Acidoferrales bacterium]
MKRLIFALLAGSLLWFPAAAGLTDNLPPVHVTIHDHAFVPRIVHVKVGQEVIWRNTDQDPHTVTSGSTDAGDGRWNSSPLIPDGGTFTLRLMKPGSYPYFCKPHQFEESMHGTIVVSE